MKNIRWEEIKNEVLDNCKKAGLTDKEFISTILKVERRVLTCKNELYERGRSWNYVTNSKPYYEGMEAMDLLNGQYFTAYGSEAKFLKEWKKYCEQTNILWDANFGDWMA
jgi:hypothetical protein